MLAFWVELWYNLSAISGNLPLLQQILPQIVKNNTHSAKLRSGAFNCLVMTVMSGGMEEKPLGGKTNGSSNNETAS